MSSIYEMLQEHAARSGAAIALLGCDNVSVSYSQLLAQVAAFGEHIGRKSVDAPVPRVAVVLPNGVRMATAFLGVSAYATCAPLNPNLKESEYEFYLEDLDVSSVVVCKDSPAAITNVCTKLAIDTIDLKDILETERTLSEAIPSEARDIGLVLHTSGTTSRPKLVPLTQKNLCSSAANVAESLALKTDDCSLNVMPLFHIHGLIGVLLGSMHAGGSVICTAGFDEETFATQLTAAAPTWYSAVPTIHQSVLTLIRNKPELLEAQNLRLIRSSSAALAPRVMSDLESSFDVPVIEAYGMTEAAHQMACNPLPPGQRRSGSVGLAAGPEVAVMSEDGEMLPSDTIGELVIRGPNVMAGYLNNDTANQGAFTNGWFRTGDQGRMDADGYIEITGRLKEIVNRGGEKVSPREIDETLLEHEAVGQAVAFAVPHDSLGEDLFAAVVRTSDVSEEELRNYAFEKLAAFKVPTRIVFVDVIPKGPTGKLQRIGLHEKLGGALEVAYVSPRTEMEEALAEFWQDVLGGEPIGALDNFFARGGDSLKGVTLIANLQQGFDIDLDIESVFRLPTLAAQASHIEEVLLQDMSGG